MKSLQNYINEAIGKARWVFLIKKLRNNVYQVKYHDQYSDQHDYGIYDMSKHDFDTSTGTYAGGVPMIKSFEKNFPNNFNWDDFIKTWENKLVQLAVDKYPHGKVVEISEWPYRKPEGL